MSFIIRRPSLVFPAGRAPGLNTRHPAAKQPLASAVPSGVEWIDVLRGNKSVQWSGGHTASMHGLMGPSVDYSADNTGSYYAVTPKTAETALTLACIFTPSNVGTVFYSYLFHVHNSASGNGYALSHYNGEVRLTKYGVHVISPRIAVANNVPYFFAVSLNGTRTITVVRRLDTGAMFYDDRADTVSPTNNSNNRISIGNAWHFEGEPARGRVSAIMVSENALTGAELQAWANDPWSFWYPHPVARARVGASAASFLSAWAANANSIIQPGVKL